MPHRAIQRQLPQKKTLLNLLVLVDLLGCKQYPNSYRKIIGRAFLAQVGGREVDRDTFEREKTTTVLDSGTHSFSGFVDCRVGQPNNRESGETSGQINFNLNERPLQPDDRTALYFGQHRRHASSTYLRVLCKRWKKNARCSIGSMSLQPLRGEEVRVPDFP